MIDSIVHVRLEELAARHGGRWVVRALFSLLRSPHFYSLHLLLTPSEEFRLRVRTTRMRALESPTCAVLYIAYFVAYVSAKKLAFVSPNLAIYEGTGSLPYYTIGTNVTIAWTTPFKQTTLRVYQQREDGSFVADILASTYIVVNLPRSQQSQS